MLWISNDFVISCHVHPMLIEFSLIIAVNNVVFSIVSLLNIRNSSFSPVIGILPCIKWIFGLVVDTLGITWVVQNVGMCFWVLEWHWTWWLSQVMMPWMVIWMSLFVSEIQGWMTWQHLYSTCLVVYSPKLLSSHLNLISTCHSWFCGWIQRMLHIPYYLGLYV